MGLEKENSTENKLDEILNNFREDLLNLFQDDTEESNLKLGASLGDITGISKEKKRCKKDIVNMLVAHQARYPDSANIIKKHFKDVKVKTLDDIMSKKLKIEALKEIDWDDIKKSVSMMDVSYDVLKEMKNQIEKKFKADVPVGSDDVGESFDEYYNSSQSAHDVRLALNLMSQKFFPSEEEFNQYCSKAMSEFSYYPNGKPNIKFSIALDYIKLMWDCPVLPADVYNTDKSTTEMGSLLASIWRQMEGESY